VRGVIRDGQTVGGTSIMGLMMLAAGQGAVIKLEAEGPERAGSDRRTGRARRVRIWGRELSRNGHDGR
jgi:hypothetical protein